MAPTLFQWDSFDKFFSPRDTSTPIIRTPQLSKEHSLPPPSSSSFSSEDDDSFMPGTPPDADVSMDDVWANVRKAKERAMSSSPSKIKSLESQYVPHVTQPPPLPLKTDFLPSNKVTRLKKGKSYVKYKESADGQTVTAIFDLPRVQKDDMHVSFQGTRLVVSWRTVKISEREEPIDDETGGTRILRELEHKKYSRTIPLPDGTRFEDIRAARDGRHLVLTYPTIRPGQAGSQPLDTL